MMIKKEWSVLTVGDGDLSFSRSIFDHYQPKKLTATVLDSETQLAAKYGNEHLDYLKTKCEVITEFDITDERKVLSLTACYDLVIFQFPLIPNFTNQQQFSQTIQQAGLTLSINTLNRRLLRLFLLNSFQHLLDKCGAQLAYISSKDVKPYIEWDIEYSLTLETDLMCLGSTAFEISQFPGYLIRNVDRDKHVKDTASVTYIWTRSENAQLAKTTFPNIKVPSELFKEHGCDICHAGPFASNDERQNHIAGKKHKRMSNYHTQWLEYLSNTAKAHG